MIVIGLVAVVKGGDMVIEYASEIAANFGMSKHLVGLTIVATWICSVYNGCQKGTAGDKLVSYDLDYLKENVKSIITPIIVSDDNVDHIKLLVNSGEKVEAGTPLIKVFLK